MNNFLLLLDSGCVCVCLLSSPSVYQDQTAARALTTEDSALLSALVGMIILLIAKLATEVACAIKKNKKTHKKTVKAGDLVKGFHPHKSHATHPSVKPSCLSSLTCSRATQQPSLEDERTCPSKLSLCGCQRPKLSFHHCATASYASQTSGDFPFCPIVVNT